jgi:Domain of unknown function (DUF3883)
VKAMSNIRVLDVEKFLPTYIIEEGKIIATKEGQEDELVILDSRIEEQILRKEKEIIEDQAIKDEEEQIFSWLDENQKLGELGEKIALEYLKGLYENLTLVSQDTKKGYDIEVELDSNKVLGFEVKTSLSNYGFHITYNELKVASNKKDDYYIFFLTVNKEENVVEGYLIQNPIDELNINFEQITNVIETQSVMVIPNKFFIKFKNGYLQNLSKLILKL